MASQEAQGRSIPLTAESLVNMYAEAAPDNARSRMALIGCPGLSLFSTISTGWGEYIRGLYYVTANNTLWCVVGLTLYKISSTGGKMSIGTIGGYGRVSMADNGTQLIIVAESIAYVVTLASDTLGAVTDSDYPNADTVAFLKSYFVFNNNQPGSKGQLFWSSSYDGATYDALDFGTAESLSDNTVAVWRDHDRLLVFGTHTTESWFASGDADAVFAPIPGAVVNRGLGARWSVANVDNRVFFLDHEGIVRVADDRGTRISTHAIEYEISQGNWRHDDSAAYDGAFASSYIEEGHEFYILTVPGRCTVVYDAATGLWHKRKSIWPNNKQSFFNTSRASFHVRAFDYVICGDTETGKLYKQSLSYVDEAGEYLVSEANFPAIYEKNQRFRVHELELVVETGVGLSESEINDRYGDIVGVCNIDGVWATQTSAADSAWEAITYGERFVAVASSGDFNVQHSTDGESWSTAIAGSLDLSAAVYNGENYDASGDFPLEPSFSAEPLHDLQFMQDGAVLYVCHGGSNQLDEMRVYNLSSPYDLSTIDLDLTNIGNLENYGDVRGFQIKSDGTKLIAVGVGSNGLLKEYSFGTAYDLTTLSLENEKDVSAQMTSYSGVRVSSDGTKAILLDVLGATLYSYAMSTPWDVSTASYESKSLSLGSTPTSFDFSSDGTVMIVSTAAAFVEYSLSTAFDISTASTTGVTFSQQTLLGTGEVPRIEGMRISPTDDSVILVDSEGLNPENILYKVYFNDPADLQDVTYGASVYSAVGPDGAFYSTLGSSWIKSDLPETQNWSGVAYSSLISKFVAVASGGTGNKVATSSDGDAWTVGSETTAFNQVAASPTAIIAVGTNGIKRSTNGTDWTSITEPADRNWTGVVYSSVRARWVIVCNDGTNNRAAYSDDDGLTWTLATTPADYNWNSVDYGQGYYVAVADSGTGQRIMRSANGSEWELVDSPADNGWNDLAWSTEGICKFAAVGDSGTGNRVMTSAAADTDASDATEGDAFSFATAAGDPQIMLDVHGCGNRVPDVTQAWRSMGRVGEHCKRVIWRRLGQHRTFTPRFTISDPVKRIVIDATARITLDD